MIEKFLQFAQALKATTVAAILLSIALLGIMFTCRAERKDRLAAEAKTAAADAKFREVARQLGLVQAQVLEQKEIEKKLGPKLAKDLPAVKKGGGRVQSHVSGEVSIADTVPGVVAPATASEPARWQDEHHRFSLDLPNGPLRRRQLFRFEAVVYRAADGSLDPAAGELDFRELDPETKEEIPVEGARLFGSVEVIQEKTPQAPAPGRFHLRAVAAVDHRLAPGAGAQVNPWKPVTISLLGFYSPKDKDGRFVAAAGWRVLGSTISIGPYVGISTKGGGLAFGGAATIELTR